MTHHTDATLHTFIARWRASGAAERANYQLFLAELCAVLEVPAPDPASPVEAKNAYVFEKAVPLPHGTTGRIDLYRRGCFVLEAKQGSDRPEPGQALSQEAERQLRGRKRGTAVRGTAAWDTAMARAHQQAQSYARNLPAEEVRDGRPPFLIIVDVGQSIALYAEFSRSGGNYIPFPDPAHYRISLDDLADAEVRALLAAAWLDPLSLDPARRSARVTREIADRLARLAQSLEPGHAPAEVAGFLMRCLFTMFAEDVSLLPKGAFTQLLADSRRNAASFPPLVEELWRTMASGGFSVALRVAVPHFNGGLFEHPVALPLTADQLQLLIEAAQADWRDVEPAIFGTLLVRALDPAERHKLGAHFTPRTSVERLVLPTIIEPLRAEWEAVQTAALLLAEGGKGADALAEVRAFQRRLASIRILDSACGSGNFLYVTLEHLKRLEGEVLEVLRSLGQAQATLELEGEIVRPEQFYGIEVNPWAAAVAELVLWIGYLQWHLRTRGDAAGLPEPILRNLHNIECRDAVLAWDAVEPLLDAEGRPVTRWDGRTTVLHPVTGEPVPDETARIPAYRYINPRPAAWPEADFIVGNPPFIGNKRMRLALGDVYVDALRMAYPDVPNAVDYVMYWWDHAARLVRDSRIERFGLITTNSISQTFNRKVVGTHLHSSRPISLVYAVPDHPWVDSSDGAAVRIAMTVAQKGQLEGVHVQPLNETVSDSGIVDVVFRTRQGAIHEDLSVGADVATAAFLTSNEGMAFQGIILVGEGFRLSKQNLARYEIAADALPPVVHRYMIGRDLVQISEERYVVDFSGLSLEDARHRYPLLLQKIIDEVKPARDTSNDRKFRKEWWLWGRSRPDMRLAISGQSRYIATCRTATHRVFVFLDSEVMPDAKIIAIALSDGYHLGVLSSRTHVVWARASGAWLGVGNDSNYNHSECFGKFPFPAEAEAQQTRIRGLAEQLDAHRKRQQAQHPKLALTDMYNVLEKLRAGEPLTAKDKTVHEQGLVSVLRQLHDELDAAVCDAYGWPPALNDDEILERLVALNAERAAEEAQGLIRWLRPEYQAPADHASRFTQHALIREDVPIYEVSLETSPLHPWPTRMAEQAQAVRAALVAFGGPASAAQVAAAFDAAPSERVAELLETLVMLGQARQMAEGRFVG